jgi:hypothetical protein
MSSPPLSSIRINRLCPWPKLAFFVAAIGQEMFHRILVHLNDVWVHQNICVRVEFDHKENRARPRRHPPALVLPAEHEMFLRILPRFSDVWLDPGRLIAQ